LKESKPLRRALNVMDGAITHPGVADAMNERTTDPATLLA
jgi:alanine dehydrogenase